MYVCHLALEWQYSVLLIDWLISVVVNVWHSNISCLVGGEAGERLAGSLRNQLFRRRGRNKANDFPFIWPWWQLCTLLGTYRSIQTNRNSSSMQPYVFLAIIDQRSVLPLGSLRRSQHSNRWRIYPQSRWDCNGDFLIQLVHTRLQQSYHANVLKIRSLTLTALKVKRCQRHDSFPSPRPLLS